MTDPMVVAVGIGLLLSAAAGPALTYGLQRLPLECRKTAEWTLIGGAVVIALLADRLLKGPAGVAFVYLLAALPGILAFLAWRTLFATMFVSLAPLYIAIASLTRGWTTHAPALAVDRAVPLQPAWMLVYGSLYPFVLILPLLVVRHQALFRRALQAYLTVMLVSYAGFVLYPTVAPRPAEVPGDGFGAWALRLAYEIDPPYGCFPSLHVAYAFVSALACYRVHRGVGTAAAVWAALIGVSTLYTKQHYFVDVIAGAFAAFVAYALFLRTYAREAVPGHDRVRAPLRALGAVGLFAIIVAGFWVAYRMDLAGS